jgi:zinc protease
MPAIRKFAAGFAALVVGAGLIACKPAEPVATAPAGALTIAPLQFTTRTLPNGLRVFAMPDTNTASASVAVWYDVGGRDDPPHRSGFAHMFEHMMFKGTANMPPEFVDRLTEDVGGFNNASTSDDYTEYHETVPANHLQRVLWMEAERMGSLVVDQANFASEREVVKEEFRTSVLGNPYGKLFNLYVPQSFFDVHPYARSTIGIMDDLNAATVEDVRQFHAAYYRPDNAVLVVSGNFDQAQLDAWVDQYFGPIAKPARPLERGEFTEPQRAAPKVVTVYEPNVQLPAVTISYPAPPATNPDTRAIMTVMDAVMTAGQSSRFYQSLIYTQQVATEANTYVNFNQNASFFAAFAILSQGKTADEGVAALKGEIARMRDTLVTQAELDEARNEIITNLLRERETSEGRADELARAVVLYGGPDSIQKFIAKVQSVTPEEIQAFARTLFDDQRTVTIKYLPESAQNGAPEDTIGNAPTIQARALAIPASEIPTFTLAPEATRVAPPAPAQPPTLTVPGAEEKTLPNGLRVIVANRPGIPLISANLRIPAGAASDPAGKWGLAAMTADVAQRGTATRSATEISRQIESLGAALNAGAGVDSTGVSVSTRSDKAGEVFAIMADVVEHPAFTAEELDRAKTEALDNLLVMMSNPGQVGARAMNRVLFGAGPYGGVMTQDSVKAITREEIAAFAASRWRPDGAVLVITGDVTPARGFELAEQAFGAWPKPATPAPEQPVAASGPYPVRTVAIDIPGVGQSYVGYGLRGPARRDPSYIATQVATDVLGGGYSARLNFEIRIKRGLSYGVGAGFGARQAASPIVARAQTDNRTAAQVAQLLAAEITRIATQPIPQAELDARKAVMIGEFGRSVETAGGLAGELAELAQFGLPLADLQSYSARVAAVTPEQASEAARMYYDVSKASLVVVGDAATFYPAIRAMRRDAVRIPVSKLDLGKETLQ